MASVSRHWHYDLWVIERFGVRLQKESVFACEDPAGNVRLQVQIGLLNYEAPTKRSD